MNVFRCLLAVIAVALLPGCVSMKTVANGGELKSYKSAYIEPLAKDEFQIYQALYYELSDMGLVVNSKPPLAPTDTDLTVRYTYDSGWDMTRYLQSFQIQYINAKDGRVVISQSYYSRGLWQGVRDQRLESSFNELRTKNGFPPTKQFQ